MQVRIVAATFVHKKGRSRSPLAKSERVLPGELVEVDVVTGLELIRTGKAVRAVTTETTMFEIPENAMKPRARGRRR